jgi:hypothetical protein
MNNNTGKNLLYTEKQFKCTYLKNWDCLSLIAILSCLVVFLLQWRQLPFFLDMYYHLGTAKGFQECAGIPGRNFWEYGPGGAPHLYPPLLHIIMLLFIKTGITDIILLRTMSVAMPAAMMLSVWYISKKMIDSRVAFFTTFLSLCASLFLISVSFTPAASLACIFFIFGLYCIYTKRILTCALLFGLVLYSHIGIFIISIVFLMLARVSKILHTRDFLKILIIAIAISTPWFLHIISGMSGITYHASANMPIRIYPVILLFAIIGIRELKRYKLFAVFLFSFIPMLVVYPFRFFCSQGMIALLVFAGIGLSEIYCLAVSKLQENQGLKKYKIFFFVTSLSYLIFFAPSIEFHNRNITFTMSDSLITSLFEGKEPGHILSTGLYDKKTIDNLSMYVKLYSKKSEFIWSNNRYLAGIIGTESGRPTISGALLEVQPKDRIHDIHNARVLIIIDDGNTGELVKHLLKNNFSAVAEEKLQDTAIRVYKNNTFKPLSLQKIPKPIIGSRVVFILLAVYSLAVIISFRKKIKC